MSSYTCCRNEKINYKDVSSLSSLLKVIGDNSRLKILCILRQGEHCVCKIIQHLGLSQTLVSHHLKDLRDLGIVSDRKDRRWSYYSLTPKGKEVTELVFSIKI